MFFKVTNKIMKPERLKFNFLKKFLLSRYRIGSIMKENSLVSPCTILQFKP